MFKIPISKPNLTQQDFLEIKKCFDSSWISSKSPWVSKFEESFAEHVVKTKYATSVNSGTSGLFLALKALGVGPGDEVILPTLTMIATVNAITLTGAKPVLVDSASKDDWNINPDKIAEKISKKTKVIMPVHLYGYPCDMEAINSLARKYKLFVIEDAAEAMGAGYKGRFVGSLSDVSCFSLYSNKIITTGNGGIVCTNNKKIYGLINKLKFFDYNSETHFRHKIIGYNMVLSGLQAALGLSQTKSFVKCLKKRRQIFSWYKKALNHTDLKFINPDKDSLPNYWFPTIVAKNKLSKTKTARALTENFIETRGFFLPIHLQPAYKNDYSKEHYPVAEYFFERGLLLPSYYNLMNYQVVNICRIILRSLVN